MKKKWVKKIDLGDVDQRILFGQGGSFLRMIESQFDAKIIARGDNVIIQGDEKEINQLEALFNALLTHLRKNNELSEKYLLYAISLVKEEEEGSPDNLQVSSLVTSIFTKEVIQPRTVGQKEYVQAMEEYDMVFSIGPAGTGKTYLAVAKAVAALKSKEVSRLVLVRPAVEAGESLGFLPGDIRAKVDPYLRPVYDALHDMLSADKIRRLMELGIIEIVPLAFMRGRTLNHAYVILDEAQNTTVAQMKMFLTRLGVNSRAVITGDITQIDLTDKKASGLVQIQKILSGIEGIEFVYLTEKDVVRHKLVQDIIRAYERFESEQ
ncbi:MAG: phosphate starvation-inducible protein PhoH [candidate division Zixibacteria bacterium RBG_16_43_9]|nr:MAG: phosphate starvation-inducible protein PhoH [candidate division Zixibacteria bacterium RBG_16_43_9]